MKRPVWRRRSRKMSGHSSRRKNQLSEVQQYLDHCTSELRIYETTIFHNELVKQRYTYWQQEKEKAAAAKDRAELLLTDKQVEALELERHLRRLQDESYVETGLTYSSWSGERSGSQLVMPVQLLCKRTIGRCRPRAVSYTSANLAKAIFPACSIPRSKAGSRRTARARATCSIFWACICRPDRRRTRRRFCLTVWGALIMCTAAGKYRRGWLLPIITRRQTA